MLVVAGSIDESVFAMALRCQYLLNSNRISQQDAVTSLRYAYQNGLTLEDALEELRIGSTPGTQ